MKAAYTSWAAACCLPTVSCMLYLVHMYVYLHLRLPASLLWLYQPACCCVCACVWAMPCVLWNLLFCVGQCSCLLFIVCALCCLCACVCAFFSACVLRCMYSSGAFSSLYVCLWRSVSASTCMYVCLCLLFCCRRKLLKAIAAYTYQQTTDLYGCWPLPAAAKRLPYSTSNHAILPALALLPALLRSGSGSSWQEELAGERRRRAWRAAAARRAYRRDCLTWHCMCGHVWLWHGLVWLASQ